MRYLDLFSGIGGFALGIQQAYEDIALQKQVQIQRNKGRVQCLSDNKGRSEYGESSICVGYSEIDKYTIQIYEKHFRHKNYGDITKIVASEIPDHDFLVGGFPCQSFSIAGKRGGFKDTRGTLFFEIARILKAKKPRLLLLENVKGLLSHDKGDTFATIISTLDELGYDCQWQVLNSKNFGVPQNRERVFIVGHIRGTSRPKVFPIGEVSTGVIKIINQARHSTNRLQSVKGIARSLRSQAGGKGAKTGLYMISRPHGFNKGGKRKYPNIRNSAIQNELVNGIRRLTPTECERLQGFPDRFTETGIDEKGNEVKISDSQRYKVLGNAVTVNVIKEIILTLNPLLYYEE